MQVFANHRESNRPWLLHALLRPPRPAARRAQGQSERGCPTGDDAEADALRPRQLRVVGRTVECEDGESRGLRRALLGHVRPSEARFSGPPFGAAQSRTRRRPGACGVVNPSAPTRSVCGLACRAQWFRSVGVPWRRSAGSSRHRSGGPQAGPARSVPRCCSDSARSSPRQPGSSSPPPVATPPTHRCRTTSPAISLSPWARDRSGSRRA